MRGTARSARRAWGTALLAGLLAGAVVGPVPASAEAPVAAPLRSASAAPAPGASDPFDPERGIRTTTPLAPGPGGGVVYRATPGEEPVGISAAPSATATGTCVAQGTLAGYQVRVHFSNPLSPCVPDALSTPGRDMNIHAEVIRLVDAVPAGSRIDGHLYAASVPAVGAALRRAQDRGVTVKISGDGYFATSTDSIMADLNALREHRWCVTGTNRACVSSNSTGISHAKLFTFSATKDPDGVLRRQVSWIASANMTIGGGAAAFNNAVTVYGDPGLYSGLTRYLDQLYAMTPRTSDYFDPATGRGYIRAATATSYASPEAQSDLVVGRLDDVAPDSSCRVRVMQASVRDTRLTVVRQLVRMRAGGCLVQVVANVVEPQALQQLKAAGIPVRRAAVHDKSFTVYGRYGEVHQSRVFVGSHNLSGKANSAYDEVFVKLAREPYSSRPLYDAYVRHFADAYDNGTPL